VIEARDLCRRFGDVEALRGVSFNAADGRVTGLLGPNGAGKTTALRIVYTALRADSGSALVDGVDAQKAPRRVQARIGVLPHTHGLYSRLTGSENIRYYGRLHGMSDDAISARIASLADLLDMRDLLARRTLGFSQGQTVKVAIARALVHDPPNVILDEPTAGLDVMSTRAMRDFIRKLRGDGRCVLFSSHIMQEVAALCDQIVVLAAGRVAAVGAPEVLRAQTGKADLEDAFVDIIGSSEGLE
jgi:sodium transport system ATP-binding protein